MSWAAERETTRVEDLAYCLMGIFNVNMPLLYGENKKAFIRLQEEIMKSSDDHTIFAWRDEYRREPPYRGLLASSPRLFKNSGHFKTYRNWNKSLPFSLTNKGLSIKLILLPFHIEEDTWLAVIDCEAGEDLARLPSIYLKCLSKEGSQYARMRSEEIKLLTPGQRFNGKLMSVYVRQEILWPSYLSYDISSFCIQAEIYLSVTAVIPVEQWDPQTQIIRMSKTVNRAKIYFTFSPDASFVVLLGVIDGLRGWCRICETSRLGSLPENLTPEMHPNSDGAYISKDRVAKVRLVPEIVLGKRLLLVRVSVEKASRLKSMLGFSG